jgi:LEA14-like dessication related protein
MDHPDPKSTIGARMQRAPSAGRRHALARSARLVALLALVPASTAGCALFFESPDVDIADVRVVSVGLVGATAEVSLTVVNPNGFTLTAREVRYRLSFADEDAEQGWRVLAAGESAEAIRVAPKDTAGVRLSVPFRYADVGRALGTLLDLGELSYRLDGDVKFDAPIRDVRVPFDRRGSFAP